MLTSRYKQACNRWLEPLAGAVARCGISPNALTLAGPLLALVICAWFVRTRAVVPFCAAMGAVEFLDLLDGAVARVGGRVTRFGAYLDALCDRYVEALVICAAAAVTGYWALSLVVLAGSLLVSYAKARAAMEAPIANTEWPDLMQRMERSVLFLGGLTASALMPWQPLGRDLFWWTLVALAILTHGTVVQRALRARNLIRARS